MSLINEMTFKRIAFVGLIFSFAFPGISEVGETRLWTGKNGTQIVGKFVSLNESKSKVFIEINGEDTLVQLTNLTLRDQFYARSIQDWAMASGASFSGRFLSINGKEVSIMHKGKAYKILLSKLDEKSQSEVKFLLNILSKIGTPKKQDRPPSPGNKNTNFSPSNHSPKYSAQPDEIKVVVTGLGESPEKAEKNALQKALRKALGEIVEAETLTDNEEIIKDQVLTYSGGFVKSLKNLKPPEKNPDFGLYTVLVEATVIRSKLIEKVKQAKTSISSLSGKNLLAEATTKRMEITNSSAMLQDLLNNEMSTRNFINPRIVKNSSEPAGPGKVKINLQVQLTYDVNKYYQSIVPQLRKLLGTFSRKKVEGNLLRNLNKSKMVFPFTNSSCTELGNPLLSPFQSSIIFGTRFNQPFSRMHPSNPWKINASANFFVAFEVRSNRDRTNCAFEVYTMERKRFWQKFIDSESRVMPDLSASVVNSKSEIIWEKMISNPIFTLNDGKSGKKRQFKFPAFTKNSNDKFGGKTFGISKIFKDQDNHSFTISPEFFFTNNSVSKGHVSSSVVVPLSFELEEDRVAGIENIKFTWKD